MNLYLLTSTMHSISGDLIAGTVGQIDPDTRAVLATATLLEAPAILKLLKDGHRLWAIYPDEEGDLIWDVEIVRNTSGVETLETVRRPTGKYRTLAELWTVDELLALAMKQPGSGH